MSHNIRFHQKSRTGCRNCKARRVKCDEGKPQCAACSRRGADCAYVVPAGEETEVPIDPTVAADPGDTSDGQRPPVAPLVQNLSEGPHYSAKHLLDLRLMHHYSVFTAPSFKGVLRSETVSNAMLRDIPRLALEHEFLMDTILLVAMVHLACTDPVSRERLPIFLYRDQALRSFRQAVAALAHQNIYAVRAASHLLATVSFASDRVTKHSGLWMANWLALAVGQRNFQSAQASRAPSSSQEASDFMDSLYGSFADISTPAATLPHIQDILPTDESDGDWEHRHVLFEATSDVGKLIGLLAHSNDQEWLEKKIKSWAFDIVPPRFLEMIQHGNPRALIILAHYLVFVNLLPDAWIYDDVASHDIELIEGAVGTEWQKYLSPPKVAIQMGDRTEIARLLISGPATGS